MKFSVIKDSDLDVDVASITRMINSVQNTIEVVYCGEVKLFKHGEDRKGENKNGSQRYFRDATRTLMVDEARQAIERSKLFDLNSDFIFFTRKQHYNNYFGIRRKNVYYLSLSGWEYLTDVPIDLGIAYFIVRHCYFILIPDFSFHDDTRGCPFDFKNTKQHIDVGLKIGRLCSSCRRLFEESQVEPQTMGSIDFLLKSISRLCRAGEPISALSSASIASDSQQSAIGDQQFKWPFLPRDPRFFSRDLNDIMRLEESFLLLSSSKDEIDSQTKGKLLERFVKNLFGCIEGFSLVAENARLQDCEIDLSFRVNTHLSELHELLGPMIFVECKNTKSPVSARDISHHIVTLSHRKLLAGVIVCAGGISGYKPGTTSIRDALSIIVEEYRINSRLILPLVWDDILALRRGLNLWILFNEKINDIILR